MNSSEGSPMLMEIKQLNTLTELEQQKLFGWGEDIFNVDPLTLHWRHKDVRFVLYDDDEPVSHAGILKHVVTVNDEPALVAGLGGVVTVPEARHKGFARRLVLEAMRFAEREWAVQAGLLFCRPRMLAYYESLGWRLVKSPVMIEQPSGKIVSPLHVMVIPFGDRAWPSGTVELQSRPW